MCLILAVFNYSSSAQSNSKSIQIKKILSAYQKAGQLNGAVLVAKEGNILYEGAFGLANMEWQTPLTVNSKFQIASITKSFTAILIMQLVEKGRINLNEFASKYVPNLPSENTSKFTIAQLLEHSSGLQRDIADFPTTGNNFPDVVAKINEEFYNLEEISKMIVSRKLAFDPGSRYGYSSDGYTLLGYIAQEVTGKSYEELLQKQIFEPLGMVQTFYKTPYDIISRRAEGYVWDFEGLKKSRQLAIAPSGGILSTVSDLLKWEQSFYSSKLLNQSSRKRIFKGTPFIVSFGWKHRKMPLAPGDTVNVLRTDGAFPGYNSLIIRDTLSKTTVIILENLRKVSYKQEEIALNILKILTGNKIEIPKPSLAFELFDEKKLTTAQHIFETRNGYYIDEIEINSLGYHYLKNDPAKAIIIFELNTKLFPNSANAYDSLGEAYLNSGNKSNAIKCYETCLKIDPKWENAKLMLEKLR